jgi:ubiquinone/menaquinone biosynthesis C-methylase UbiE
MTGASSYPLGYSEDEAPRLARQAALLEDLTEDVFRRAGIISGMRVLDLGSGVGDVSFLAARIVGPSGTVLGIERNALSVETASQRAEKAGVCNVRFEMADLESFESPHAFDAVIGRFVLLYLPNPAATLRRFRKLLKPYGVIAFQESDMEQASQVPSSELFSRVLSWIIGAFRAAGVEPNMGGKLLTTFLAAGLPRPTMIASMRAESGPHSEAYDYVTQSVRSLLPLVERAGLATSEEVAIDTLADRLRQDAILHERVTFLPRMVGAWSRDSATLG